MRSFRQWTQQEVEQLKMFADDHMRVNAIARKLNRTTSSLRTKAFKEGISLIEISIPML